VIGVLTGLEIPLAMALREDGSTEAKGVSRLLSADYVGGLVGSLLFAFLLLPTLEINGAAIAACLGNAVVAVYLASHLPLRRARSWVVFAVTIATLFMAVRFAQKAHEFRKNVDQKIYSRTEDTVIRSNFRTRYQKVVMTTTKYETRKYEWFEVYLNGYIQADAYHASVTDAYHHALVHSAMAISKKRDRVLILGGGDGLPAKEVLKYGNEVKRLVMVDLDGEWVKFSKTNPIMRAHNHNALSHPKLELNISDAFRWVRHSRDVFDLIFVDFPEGVDYPLARSYSVEFLSDLKRLLADGGVAVFQSDTYDDSAYWCIVKTMQASGYDVIPFHTREEEPEGVIFLTKGPADLSTLDAKLARRSFVHRNLAPGRAQLAAARNHTEIRKKTAKVEVNTFYHPVYLTYRRFEQSDDSVISWW